MEDKRNRVSIVVPFYNEGKGANQFYKSLTPLLAQVQDIEFEVICVDDGSTDDTLSRLLELAEKDARFHIVELSRNFSKDQALMAGIDYAKGDAVIPIDADLQDPPDLIPRMITKWREGFEMVLARRVDRSADSYLKRTTAGLFYWLHNCISETKIPYNVGDYRLMDRVVVDALQTLPERQRFMKGLFAWVGFRTTVLDYVRNTRSYGQSKFSGRKLWNFALEGITSFSTVPLKISTYVGLIGAIITLVYALFIIAKTVMFGVEIPGYASLMVAVLFFGSLQMIGIGILGEYIGRIYLETKQRPPYIVRKIHGGKNGA